MYYKGIDKKVGGVQLSESIVFKKIKLSHLLITMTDDIDVTSEASKIIIDVNTSGGGVPSRQLITRVNFKTLCEYTQRLGSVGISKDNKSMYSLIPIGSMDLDDMDLNVEINSSSAFSSSSNLRFTVYAIRISDVTPVLEFQEREIITQGKTFTNVVALFDINCDSTSTNVTKITFDNSSQININHDIAHMFTNSSDQIFDVINWATLFLDKDMGSGRNIKVEPTNTFVGLVVQVSILNGMLRR
ncbi:MAG: hypothetical protein FWH53_00530 [Leptospirales bacterium]|nr:hypothetical protein [Leptospirales bacterium]